MFTPSTFHVVLTRITALCTNSDSLASEFFAALWCHKAPHFFFMFLQVKTLDGRVFSFTVTADMVVKDFKQLVADKIDVPVEKQRIIFRGKVRPTLGPWLI